MVCDDILSRNQRWWALIAELCGLPRKRPRELRSPFPFSFFLSFFLSFSLSFFLSFLFFFWSIAADLVFDSCMESRSEYFPIRSLIFFFLLKSLKEEPDGGKEWAWLTLPRPHLRGKKKKREKPQNSNVFPPRESVNDELIGDVIYVARRSRPSRNFFFCFVLFCFVFCFCFSFCFFVADRETKWHLFSSFVVVVVVFRCCESSIGMCKKFGPRKSHSPLLIVWKDCGFDKVFETINCSRLKPDIQKKTEIKINFAGSGTRGP